MPRGIPAAGYRKTRSKTVSVNTVHEPVPSKFTVSERFEFIEQFIKMIGTKKTNSVILTGDPGLGKSYTVVNKLKSLGMREILLDNDGDFIVIKGYSTPRFLYETLYNYNGKVVIFDDADAIHKDDIGSNMLKAALDSGPNRILTWGKKTVENDDIPTRFEFTGRCIFISNLSITQFPPALLSRSYAVDLTLTIPEKLKRIEMVIHEYPGKTHEVMEFFNSNAKDFKDVSIRSALSVLKLANSLPNWEKLASYSMSL